MQWPICHSEMTVTSTEFKDKQRRMKRIDINVKVPKEDTEPEVLLISRKKCYAPSPYLFCTDHPGIDLVFLKW